MEADEEEEDGAQTGLGDFGFGSTKGFKEIDDERVNKCLYQNFYLSLSFAFSPFDGLICYGFFSLLFHYLHFSFSLSLYLSLPLSLSFSLSLSLSLSPFLCLYFSLSLSVSLHLQNALKLRDGDLDHIVDDLSDDEGDEELGRIARIAQEREDDRSIIPYFLFFHVCFSKMIRFTILFHRYFFVFALLVFNSSIT